ncbi:uncharacterized protein FOMMEDRAFT_88853 [Fomitiporia mediterranea MF3/22]|uniref:uncharacterized protein n=1 Tax=Fomitiporia mediterranea (strain MF3/22) TaxID=694068 RepID=UPI0004409C62|nr:uncharacterized protein FOMMEDRAFT_88853 [Fomitiporia mediterranea MF3/22]EJD01292.1 hypothetical protein FOMMEDRAFT_88853 [Fomitiporia mediterranea MF3/22]
MDDLLSYDAILFPADGRPPQVVELPTSPLTRTNPQTGQLILVSVMPHPEVHMDTITDTPNQRAWRVQVVESLDGMTMNFANPYIIFYPTMSRTGAPFPVNRAIREIQGSFFNESTAWRGNIIVAKYRGGGNDPFMSLIDISMADFPILKNYFLNRGPSGQVGSGPVIRVEFPDIFL